MLKALAWKELRELLPVLSVALVGEFYFVSTAVGIQLGPLDQNRHVIPFIGDGYVTLLLSVAGLAAIVFGLWQTLRESSQGTYQFLLHRPARRKTIFAAKLAVGVVALLAVGLAPVLLYALWAATPGAHASPFEWPMTAGALGTGADHAGVVPGRVRQWTAVGTLVWQPVVPVDGRGAGACGGRDNDGLVVDVDGGGAGDRGRFRPGDPVCRSPARLLLTLEGLRGSA